MQVQQTLLNSTACQEALGEARFKDSSGNYLNVDYRFASNAMICTAGELLTHVKEWKGEGALLVFQEAGCAQVSGSC